MVTVFGPSLALLRVVLLFAVTAVAEIVGCYLPWLVIKQGKPLWLLLPTAASRAAFAWLLTLHPTAAGRTYAAYGGVYIAVAIGWLWVVEGIRPSLWDVIGTLVALTGMAIIMFAPKPLVYLAIILGPVVELWMLLMLSRLLLNLKEKIWKIQ